MKPEAQRIAIAEARGALWVKYCANNYRVLTFDHGAQRWPADGSEDVYKDGLYQVPDYLNDLNAMHEAEKKLKSNQDWGSFISHLSKLVRDSDEEWWFIHATAAQRAEAFLRTLNLYTE